MNTCSIHGVNFPCQILSLQGDYKSRKNLNYQRRTSKAWPHRAHSFWCVFIWLFFAFPKQAVSCCHTALRVATIDPPAKHSDDAILNSEHTKLDGGTEQWLTDWLTAPPPKKYGFHTSAVTKAKKCQKKPHLFENMLFSAVEVWTWLSFTLPIVCLTSFHNKCGTSCLDQNCLICSQFWNISTKRPFVLQHCFCFIDQLTTYSRTKAECIWNQGKKLWL